MAKYNLNGNLSGNGHTIGDHNEVSHHFGGNKIKGKYQLPKAVCAAAAEAVYFRFSEEELDILFEEIGASDLSNQPNTRVRLKSWLIRTSKDPTVDGLSLIGDLIEEFMDLPMLEDPFNPGIFETYLEYYNRLNATLDQHGLRYFPGGQVLPVDSTFTEPSFQEKIQDHRKPQKIEELLEIIIAGLRRAMHPLEHRRKGATPLSFESEYDIQDLLHALLRPWIGDIRPEENTPSHAGSGARMDFLLPRYKIVLETKRIRDERHAKKIGEELTLDIAHYKKHPDCTSLWCIIYDPLSLIENPDGIKRDLEGEQKSSSGTINVQTCII